MLTISVESDQMEYVKLGNTGLDVSRLCLGCMGFGEAGRWIHQWMLDEENSRSIKIVGRALKDIANWDDIVMATKVHGRMHDGPNGAGLSRKAIMSEIDKNLKRLGTDYNSHLLPNLQADAA